MARVARITVPPALLAHADEIIESPDESRREWPITEVARVKGARRKPSYRSVAPLDIPTITYVQLSR